MLKMYFGKIRFNILNLVLDPLLGTFLGPCLKGSTTGFLSKANYINRAISLFRKESDMSKIIRKVRESHNMLKFLICSDDKAMLKVS